jgi:hypothetical protein
MVPQDQQDCGTCNADFAVFVVRDESLMLVYLFKRISNTKLQQHCTDSSPGRGLLGEDGRACRSFAGMGARATHSLPHAENEVPQPHDLVACGFTKTKPCCISVSW